MIETIDKIGKCMLYWIIGSLKALLIYTANRSLEFKGQRIDKGTIT